MQYHYIASQPDGKITEGDVEARNVEDVLAYLSQNNLKPVSVKPIEEGGSAIFSKFFGGKITITDQIFISKYLALMLKIGTGLLEAINILIADFRKPAVRKFLIEIRSALEQGRPFYSTFAKHPRVFGVVYVNLVRAGEASGNLEKVFNDLTQILTKQKDLQDQMKSALTYPILLLIGAILILTFLVIFALPRIANVFLEGGFDPPAFSKAVFAVGIFMSNYGFYVIGFFVILAISAVILYKSSLFFKKFVFSVIGEIPIIKDVFQKTALQRFASVLSSLIKAGIPLTEALEVAAPAVGNAELEGALIRISREGLAKGLTVGEAFRKESFFPQSVVNLMAISERAGHVEEVLDALADFYTKEIDSSVKTLVSFLEPVLLIVIGGVIGVIALSIIIPIYQLTTQF